MAEINDTDLRLGDLINDSDEPEIIIVGFPSDQGIITNGGRPGARDGPEAIRSVLYRLTPASEAAVGKLASVSDIGNITVTGDVGTDQTVLGDVLAEHLERERTCIVLGGGHETTYGHYLGYTAIREAPSILNVDAHPDVRPLKDGLPHSGSSFRLALEHSEYPCPLYQVIGLRRESCSLSHLDLMRRFGAHWRFSEETSLRDVDRFLDEARPPCLVSLDLDALDQSLAPGVSAPNANGLKRDMWFDVVGALAANTHVRSFDICELSPRLDPTAGTTRVAALTVWTILHARLEAT